MFCQVHLILFYIWAHLYMHIPWSWGSRDTDSWTSVSTKSAFMWASWKWLRFQEKKKQNHHIWQCYLKTSNERTTYSNASSTQIGAIPMGAELFLPILCRAMGWNAKAWAGCVYICNITSECLHVFSAQHDYVIVRLHGDAQWDEHSSQDLSSYTRVECSSDFSEAWTTRDLFFLPYDKSITNILGTLFFLTSFFKPSY